MQTTVSIDEAVKLATEALKSGDIERCISIAESILKTSPSNADAMRLQGLVAERQGDMSRALARLTDAAQADPDNPGAFEELARIMSDLGRWQEAAQCLQQALIATRARETRHASEGGDEAIYRQIEALTQLTHVVNPRLPLPPLRGWAISPDFGVALAELVLTHKPRLIVELGSGASTLINGYLLERLGNGGRIVSLDHEPDYAHQTRDRVQAHGLQDLAEIRHAPLTPITIGGETWQWYDTTTLDDVMDIDLVVVDGPPAALQSRSRFPALPALKDKLRPDAIILMDDAARADEKAIAASWAEALGNSYEVQWLTAEKGAAVIRPRG